MSDNNIIPMREPLAKRLRRALDEWHAAGNLWIDKTIALALEFKASRDHHGGDDRSFGTWLIDNDLDDVGKNTRLALIGIGENIETARRVLEKTGRGSVRYIWEQEIRPRLSLHRERSVAGIETAKPALVGPSEPPKADTPEQTATAPPESKDKISNERHPFYGMSRSAEIAALYRHGTSRWLIGSVLKKRGGKALWDLILIAADAGFLTPHNSHPNQPTIRLLFPATPSHVAADYLLTSQQVLADLRDRIMPILLANREAFIAAPDQFHLIVKRHEESRRQQTMTETRNNKLVTARQSLPANETEVILFGKHFWPIVDIDDPDQRYDYQQLQAAAWFFDDALKLARNGKDNSPKSCGMKIRFLVKRMVQFNDTIPIDMRKRWRQMLGLITELTRIMEQAPPDAEIGNRLPLLPSDRSEA